MTPRALLQWGGVLAALGLSVCLGAAQAPSRGGPPVRDWTLVMEAAVPETMRTFRYSLVDGIPDKQIGTRPPQIDLFHGGTGEIFVGEAPCGGRALVLRRQPSSNACCVVFAPPMDSMTPRFQVAPNDRFKIEFEYHAPTEVSFRVAIVAQGDEHLKLAFKGIPSVFDRNKEGELTTTALLAPSEHWTPVRGDIDGITRHGTFYIGMFLNSDLTNATAAVRNVRVFHSTD